MLSLVEGVEALNDKSFKTVKFCDRGRIACSRHCPNVSFIRMRLV
jgi:hypothetical protein